MGISSHRVGHRSTHHVESAALCVARICAPRASVAAIAVCSCMPILSSQMRLDDSGTIKNLLISAISDLTF